MKFAGWSECIRTNPLEISINIFGGIFHILFIFTWTGEFCSATYPMILQIASSHSYYWNKYKPDLLTNKKKVYLDSYSQKPMKLNYLSSGFLTLYLKKSKYKSSASLTVYQELPPIEPQNVRVLSSLPLYTSGPGSHDLHAHSNHQFCTVVRRVAALDNPVLLDLSSMWPPAQKEYFLSASSNRNT